MDCGIRPWKRFTRSRRKRADKPKSAGRLPALLNADLRNQTKDVVVEDVIEFALVFFFQAFAQEFCSDEAGFSVGQFTAGLFAEHDEGRMRKSDDTSIAVIIEKEFRVNRVRVARGDAVPNVRKLAV